MINTKNLILRNNKPLESQGNKKSVEVKQTADLTQEKKDAVVVEASTKAAALKTSVEKSTEKGYISSAEIMHGTSLDTKLLKELGSPEKVKEFMDKIDNVWFRAINNMSPGLDVNTAHTMATAINAYFIESLDLSVKKGDTKVEDVFGALKNMNFASVSFDGILGGFIGLFEKSTLLYNLTKNSTKIAKILRSNKQYIGDGKDISVLNDPNKFKDLLKDEKILKLEEKDIYLSQNADLMNIFAKSTKTEKIDTSKIRQIYENHGQVLSQESVGKMVKSLNGVAAGADKVFPIMDQITGRIDNNGKNIIKKVDDLMSNPVLEKLGLAGSLAGVKELINTILGFFGRDYESIVKGDKQNFDIKAETKYEGSSFSQEQFLALTQTYESVVGNLPDKCLKEVRKFMQALNRNGYIDLPSDIDNDKSWGEEAKDFSARLKNYANAGLPKERSEKGIQAADISNKSDSSNDIYNAISPMKGDLFNIVMKKVANDGGSRAGHIAFASRVGQDIYIYDNSIKGEGDLDFVAGKNGFSLAKYISLMKGKYNFDSVMSVPSKYYKENNSESTQLAGSPAVRNNNPGNITDTKYGGTKAAGEKFTKFASMKEGHDALVAKIKDIQAGKSQTYSTDMTITEYIGKYAPASDGNNVNQYASNIAKELGVELNTKIKDLDAIKLASAHAKFEDGQAYKMLLAQNVIKQDGSLA